MKRLSMSISHWPARFLLGVTGWRRSMTLGVRAAIFNSQGEVFLVRHTYIPGWYLPGGGVEPGETLAEALARELMEEGGIALDKPAKLFSVYLNRGASSRDHVALFVSHAGKQVTRPRKPNLEIIDYGFYAPNALPDKTSAATRQRLAEIELGLPASEEW